MGSKALVPTRIALPWPYRILLAGNLAFCMAGLVFTKLPSWRMFEAIPDPRYVMTDATGRSVRVEDYLPHDAYSFRAQTLVNVALFVCERGAAPAPLALTVGEQRFRIKRVGKRCVSRVRAHARR